MWLLEIHLHCAGERGYLNRHGHAAIADPITVLHGAKFTHIDEPCINSNHDANISSC